MDPNQPNPQPSNIPPLPNNDPQPPTEPSVTMPSAQPTPTPNPSANAPGQFDATPNPQSQTSEPPPQQPAQPIATPEPISQLAVQPIAEADTAGPLTPKRKSKKLLIMGGAIATFLLLSSAIVFGYYLPNRPNRVYNTGLNRSAESLNKLVNTATEKSKLEALKKSDIKLSLTATYGKDTYKGNLNSKFDASKSEGSVDFVAKQSGKPNQTFNAKYVSELPAGSQYPDIYFQLNGIKSLGIDSYLPGASVYDGKWIAVGSDYLESLASSLTAQDIKPEQLTSDDIAELARTATTVTSEYVFSTDTAKAVFEKKSFVGKEKVDGLDTYHYQVGLNKANVKSYCQAMVKSIYSTRAFKKYTRFDNDTIEKMQESAAKDCNNSVDAIKTDSTYDLWIDAKYKLVTKIRIPDATNKDIYADIGQIFTGGDSITIYVAYHDGKNKNESKFTLETNFKTNTTMGTLVLNGGESRYTYDVKATFDAKSFEGEINTTKPSGAIPIQDVLQKLGIDQTLFGAGSFTGTGSTTTTSAQ